MGEYNFGLLGEKLIHSMSPQLHKLILETLKIKGDYKLYEVSESMLKISIEKFKLSKLSGLNVTIPYKTKIIDYLEALSPEAEKIGAVNTIKFDEKGAKGFNTDYFGFKLMLDRYSVDVKNKNVVVFGSGGASKAVIQALTDMKVNDLLVLSRDKKNKKSNNKIEFKTYNEIVELEKYGIAINCTPCGMYPDTNCCPIDLNLVKSFETVVDLIYNPKKTKFIETAEKSGIKTLNGLYMLVAQGVKSQSIWNDIEIDFKFIDLIYDKLCKAL